MLYLNGVIDEANSTLNSLSLGWCILCFPNLQVQLGAILQFRMTFVTVDQVIITSLAVCQRTVQPYLWGAVVKSLTPCVHQTALFSPHALKYFKYIFYGRNADHSIPFSPRGLQWGIVLLTLPGMYHAAYWCQRDKNLSVLQLNFVYFLSRNVGYFAFKEWLSEG